MINYYGPVLFQETMGMSRNLSMLLGGGMQCTYLVGSAIPVFLMDRFGRRSLLMICSAGLCLCFVMVTILLSLNRTDCAYGATVFIFIFQIFYGIGWLPVPWFYPSEINTTRVRTRMSAIASGWNWMAVFAVVKITPIAFGMFRIQAPLWMKNIGISANRLPQKTLAGKPSSSSLCSMPCSSRWSTSSTQRLKESSWRTFLCSLQRVALQEEYSAPRVAGQSRPASMPRKLTWTGNWRQMCSRLRM